VRTIREGEWWRRIILRITADLITVHCATMRPRIRSVGEMSSVRCRINFFHLSQEIMKNEKFRIILR